MRCPVLSELPMPPVDRTGWPWTHQGEQLPDTAPGGKPWPRITIVTPSYNQGKFLEEAIRSVLLQGYPDLEYMVLDGGSDDNSTEILAKYEPWLAYSTNEKDKGQANAINRGFARSTGRVLAWLNSDDVYCPGALKAVGSFFASHPDKDFLVASCDMIHEDGSWCARILAFRPTRADLMAWGHSFAQPASFWTSELYAHVGPLDESLYFCLDYDFYMRVLRHTRAQVIRRCVAQFRLHSSSKTTTADNIRLQEEEIVRQRYNRDQFHPLRLKLLRHIGPRRGEWGQRVFYWAARVGLWRPKGFPRVSLSAAVRKHSAGSAHI